MTDRLLLDLALPKPADLPPFSPLPPSPDENLFLTASARWRESSQALRELAAASPTIRDTLDQLLKQSLDLNGQHAGLLFAGTDEQPESFVSFTQACAFVLQHPTLETTLDQQWRVTGLGQAHPLLSLTPLQMLERLKTLDPELIHGDRWRIFWAQRAPGTAISRQERVIQLYRNHFEAAAQLAVARNTLTQEQLTFLQLLIDPPIGPLALNAKPIHTEQVALVLSNSARIKLTGAWVITAAEATSGWQLLYLPSKPVAIQVFNQRNDMEDWLSSQALVPTGLPSDDTRFEYTANTSNPLVVGSSDLFAAHLQAQVTALRHGTRGKPGLAAHGAQSLVQADQVDRQRNHVTFFASPPRLEAAGDIAETDETSLFGNLYADIPWSLRQRTVKKQRDALEALVEDVGEGEGLQPFKDSLKALANAEQAADTAASDLLNRSRTLDLDRFQQAFTALHRAHKTGLHAEAALQLALEQLDDDDCSLLKALLDTPDDPGPDRVAASLTLSLTSQEGETSTVTSEALKGAFIMTRAQVLADPDSPHSVLLYWPGTGGGLQRFANRRELERQVFKIHDRSDGLSVQLKKITGDALLYGLEQLTGDFEVQAAAIRQRHVESADAVQRAEQLDILRQKSLATLQVPVHAARSLAIAHLLEQDQSATLASNLPDWLSKLTEADRAGLKDLFEAYIPAMQRSHQLMTIALEPRDDFTRKHLHARLSKDFSTEGQFAVQVDFPDSTTIETASESGPGGVRKNTVIVPGSARSKMSLEDLAQLNIDNVHSVLQDSLSQRLVFMRLEVSAAQNKDRLRLLNGIDLTYLRKVLPELDLPKAYEQLILEAFKGSATESVFVKEHRRESLVEPWRLMLKIQGECARLQKHINSDELQVLNIAIDANTPEAWTTAGKRVAILPVSLKVGGQDTPREGLVTLSGVTFIEEQISGVTLLYLPDSHDGQFLRRYDSLEAARKGLYNLCGNDKWIDYLAHKTLQGNVRAHVSRINQAVEKNFDGMIEVGTRWPTTTSLAAHLLDAHMGRLLEAHRGTSRSNDDLYLERYTLKGPRAFNYIKMAVGMLPFIGSAIALYDAWTSANQAVAAFLRGEVGDGVAELGSVLLSLIDAAMDLLPGEVAFSVGTRAARSLARARQLHRMVRHTAALHGVSQRQARHVLARFAGYEFEQPLSLAGLQPATHGLYRGIFRHAEGDFIERQGRLFQVELSQDSRNWRLSGNAQKTYKQPIALDETDHWDTWYGVYGTTFEGGGLGGGQRLGHLADALDPIWPLAIRQRLPRFWRDRAYRREGQLEDITNEIADRYNIQRLQTTAALDEYGKIRKLYKLDPQENADTPQPDTELSSLSKAEQAHFSQLVETADTACANDIDLVIPRYEALEELKSLARRDNAADVRVRSECAWVLADRCTLRYHFVGQRIDLLVEQADDLLRELDTVPSGSLDQFLSILEKVRTLRVKIVSELDKSEELINQSDRWFRKITPPKKHGTNKTPDEIRYAELKEKVESLNQTNTVTVLTVKIGHLLEMVKRVDATTDTSWLELQRQTRNLRVQMDQAVLMHHDLSKTVVTRDERNKILQECFDVYTQFRRGLRAWTASYPQHFHVEWVEPLLMSINKLTERARKGVGGTPVVKPVGKINKKVFITEDDQLLIGTERLEKTTQARQYVLTGPRGTEVVWEQGSNGKFRLLNPPTQAPAPIQTDLATLVSDARKRLDNLPAHQTQVQAYARQNTLPVDLEHMMVFEADTLTGSARRIETTDATNPIIQELLDKATELRTIGRQMRTSQALASKKPTDGMLDDLIGQNAAEIRKTRPLKNLGKRKNGRSDHMQEYEVWNTTIMPNELLWYAHFHYSSAKPVMRNFEKAHLKLPEHRFLTHADDADLPYADIGQRSPVVVHFEEI